MLKARELYITETETEQGRSKVVRIKGSVAFDEGFIQECLENGVKEFTEEDKE